MGFRSGDWLGHSRTLICFFLSHSFVALAICFGSLSCWKTHPRPIFSALTEGRRLSPKISRYTAPFILPSIRWSRPVHLAEKHPQSIRFPPPCFTVGMVFLGLYSAFLFLQTWWGELMPNSSIFVMPWTRGVDQWADPSKQYETQRDMIARRRLMFEQGEGEKENKQKQKKQILGGDVGGHRQGDMIINV